MITERKIWKITIRFCAVASSDNKQRVKSIAKSFRARHYFQLKVVHNSAGSRILTVCCTNYTITGYKPHV